MQTNKIEFRRIARWFLALAAVVYAAASIISAYVSPTQYANCEKDTKDLNGGIKTFGGQQFNIVLCGDGGDENLMNDKVRMQILSESGVLLAQRTFQVDWESNRLRELAYGEDYLIYFDASQNNNYKHKVNMPPTWFDWVRARLPLAN